VAPAASVTGRTVGLVGWPLAHSVSPRLFRDAFRRAGLPWRYERFPVQPNGLARLVASLRAQDVRGFNVTIPHKQAVRAFLDTESPAARAVGAVNCVRIRNGKLWGTNTDLAAFVADLRAHRMAASVRGKRVVLLGAGGAARACAFGLLSLRPSELVIANRDLRRARNLAADVRRAALSPRRRVRVSAVALRSASPKIRRAALLVNATSVGLRAGDRLPISDAFLRAPLAVYDLLYNPPVTDLLRRARLHGCLAVGGIGMLTRQAAAAFRLWTGRKPSPGAFDPVNLGHHMITKRR